MARASCPSPFLEHPAPASTHGLLVARTWNLGAFAAESAPARPDAKTKPVSLVAKINSVTVLEIFTDRPIARYRLVIDGKAKDEKLTYESASNHLCLAAVPSGEWANIHMKIGYANCLLSEPFVMGANTNRQNTDEYMFPTKEVSIGDWTTIYRVTIKEDDHVVRCIEVQISGAQPKPDGDGKPAP